MINRLLLGATNSPKYRPLCYASLSISFNRSLTKVNPHFLSHFSSPVVHPLPSSLAQCSPSSHNTTASCQNREPGKALPKVSDGGSLNSDFLSNPLPTPNSVFSVRSSVAVVILAVFVSLSWTVLRILLLLVVQPAVSSVKWTYLLGWVCLSNCGLIILTWSGKPLCSWSEDWWRIPSPVVVVKHTTNINSIRRGKLSKVRWGFDTRRNPRPALGIKRSLLISEPLADGSSLL